MNHKQTVYLAGFAGSRFFGEGRRTQVTFGSKMTIGDTGQNSAHRLRSAIEKMASDELFAIPRQVELLDEGEPVRGPGAMVYSTAPRPS